MHGKVGCDWLPESSSNKGAKGVVFHGCHCCSNYCTRHMLEELVEVEGEELLYDSMLRYADGWMGGRG